MCRSGSSPDVGVNLEEHCSVWPTMHAIFRWPLFLVLCIVIGTGMVLYIITRFLVVVLEWLLTPSVVQRTRCMMAEAHCYEHWLTAAEALDKVTGRNAWKAERQSQLYAHKLVASATEELCSALEKRDYKHMLRCLQRVLRNPNFAGHLNEDLFSKSFAGTKFQIDYFCAAVCHGLRSVRDEVERLSESGLVRKDSAMEAENGSNTSPSLDLVTEARRFCEFARCTFGRTALCLSGGGAIALQHFGLVSELFNRGLLPQVISGTSGGAVVACYVCCRTDEELRGEVSPGQYPLKLEPKHIHSMITWPFHGTWSERLAHYFKHGCLFFL